MKLRFLAVVLGAIAIMTSGTVFADGDDEYQEITTKYRAKIPTVEFMVKGSDADTKGAEAPNYVECIEEEHSALYEGLEAVGGIFDKALAYMALRNSHERTKLEYNYLNTLAAQTNTWRMMDTAMYYSTQQQIALYQYKYGSYGYGSNGGYRNNNQGVNNYARDRYTNAYDEWLGGGLI